MKIGIITYQRSVSYGAFLQTYALSRYLMGLGHDVKVIDYNPAHRDSKTRPWDRRLCGLHPQNLVNAYKHRCFSDYTEEYLPLTDRRYRTLKELQDDPPAMDAYVCGSDQIWNPEHIGGGFDPAYFGCFGEAHIKRIAYAPSIGSRGISPEFHQALCDNVSGLDHLSAREKSGCDLITSITGRQCTHVLDPTLLISDYSEILNDDHIATEPYVLVFSLSNSSLLYNVLAIAKRELGFPALFVANHYKIWQYGWRYRFCTPGEWLCRFAGARAVITDSFHGTAFALSLQKPFIAVSLPERLRDRNVRLTDMLQTVGLSERFVADESSLHNSRLIAADVDWSTVRERLSVLIGRSEKFLAESLAPQG